MTVSGPMALREDPVTALCNGTSQEMPYSILLDKVNNFIYMPFRLESWRTWNCLTVSNPNLKNWTLFYSAFPIRRLDLNNLTIEEEIPCHTLLNG